MYQFDYHPPSIRGRGRSGARRDAERQAARRRPYPDPDAEAAAGQCPAMLVDLGGIARAEGHPPRRRQPRHRRDDRACRGGRERRGEASAIPALGLARRPASATRRCAIAAPSAARSPTTTRRPTIRRRCWRWAPPSSPTSARSRRTTSSPACSPPRSAPARSSRRSASPCPEQGRLRQVRAAGLALLPGRRVRRQKAGGMFSSARCAWRCPVRATAACSACRDGAGAEGDYVRGRCAGGVERSRPRASWRHARQRRISRRPHPGDGGAGSCWRMTRMRPRHPALSPRGEGVAAAVSSVPSPRPDPLADAAAKYASTPRRACAEKDRMRGTHEAFNRIWHDGPLAR